MSNPFRLAFLQCLTGALSDRIWFQSDFVLHTGKVPYQTLQILFCTSSMAHWYCIISFWNGKADAKKLSVSSPDTKSPNVNGFSSISTMLLRWFLCDTIEHNIKDSRQSAFMVFDQFPIVSVLLGFFLEITIKHFTGS